MSQRETSEDIDLSAASWAARIDRAPLSTEEQRDLDRWLAGDTRRLGAFARAQAVLIRLDRARALGADFERSSPLAIPKPRAPQRRDLLRFGALAAGLGGVAVAASVLWRPTAATYSTRRGEMRRIALGDGSTVTLNTNTLIEVRYGPTARRVTLRAGEALFDVAKDPHRPFTVAANRAEVRAVGTRFTVARSPERVQVMVCEGLTEFRAEKGSQAALSLPANTQAVLTPAGLVKSDIDTAEVSRALAWTDGMIAFDGDSLGEAVAEFARYSDARIEFGDPAIAERRVTGLFSENNPMGFARAVAVSMNLTVTPIPGGVRLSE